MFKADVRGNNFNNLVKWLGLSFIAFMGFLSINSLSGNYTIAEIGIEFASSFKVNTAVSYVFGLSGVLYGLFERDLRKRTIERMSKRTTELELSIDPNRSSSNLTPRGNTRPEDE